ncbi:hypothetical protein [Parathalassolituus penaei]|uniref:Uncharacterized protein n=1 Tax=Parathalassolituus penaei TaxID=2997323 RepID=A0A9X3IRI0_9GAMM|nr:hypothetical protein [Parathalassolituus penaei]MCY0964265.1 hypothetical protein [Parathalassolituus penaei]
MKGLDLFAWMRRVFGIGRTRDIAWLETRTYQQRLEWVKSGWIIAGLLMLAADNNAAALGIAMFSTFLSFAFLERDEEEPTSL